jgi:basic membrane protein A
MKMKKLNRIAVFVLVVLAVFAITSIVAAESSEKSYKVALINEGAINDMSWNYTAYLGLMKCEELGAEVAYVENIAISDAADALRAFADEGYDVIFCSGYTFMDSVKAVAPDYPEVQFFIINSTLVMDNVNSIRVADAEQGFLMGALSALMTKSGTIGFVGGLNITPIINGGKGFEQGAAYVNPEVKTIINMTGSGDDVDAAKELALAMISQGVDVISPMADQASLGVMQAAEESSISAIASGEGMQKIAPNATIVEIVKDTSIAYEAAYKSFLEGNITDEILYMGVNYGVIYMSDYFADIPEEVKAEMEDIMAKLAAGEIEISID